MMNRFRQVFLMMILLLGGASFLLVSCGSEVQTAMTTGSVSIARRGQSLLTPIVPTVENSPELTATLEPVTSTPGFTPTIIVTPEVTETSPAPTISPTATDVKQAQGGGQATEQETLPSDDCPAKENRGFEAEVIALVNKVREENGIRAFAEQSQLAQSARLHSQDMACNQFFSHLSPTAGTLLDRIAVQGYQYSAVAENLAAGYVTPVEVVEGWMTSPGHRENLLNPQYTQVGVGYMFVADSANGTYWTIILGTP